MAILEQPFYHKTIRTYTAVFGQLFNDLKIRRDNGDVIKVPIANLWQEKANVRLEQNPKPGEVRYQARLPRIGFALVGWNRAGERQGNKMHQLVSADHRTTNGTRSQYNRVPYNFEYQLSIRTKYVDDMLQLVEQIAVHFSPSLQVVIEDNPDLLGDTALNITLNNHTLNTEFEGSFEQSSIVQVDMNFTLEGYLYMPTSSAGVIKKVIINYRDLDDPDTILLQDTFTEDDLDD